MKLKIGIALTLIGTIVALVAIVMALRPIGALYDQGINDPMATRGPDIDPKLASSTALTWVIVGITGAVTAAVGGFLMGGSIIKVMLKKLNPPQPR
jgi:hypothetical protein